MDRLDAMSLLISVVEAGSLSAAGRKLGMPLATVSRKLSDLEAHLRTQLLTRSSRHLALTDAGASYVAACRRILEEVGEAERAAAGEYSAPQGELIVTAPLVFGRLHVLPVVTAFLRAYPAVDVRLALADRVVDLGDEHVDAAVRIGELPDSQLRATRVGTMRRVICASPAYLAARGVPQRPEDLARHDCISFDNIAGPDRWRFPSGVSLGAIAVHSRLVVNAAEAAIDAAVDGLGITYVLSYQAARAIRDGTLRVVLTDFAPPPVPIHLVYAGQRMLPLKLRAFLDYATPRLKARLTQDGV